MVLTAKISYLVKMATNTGYYGYCSFMVLERVSCVGIPEFNHTTHLAVNES